VILTRASQLSLALALLLAAALPGCENVSSTGPGATKSEAHEQCQPAPIAAPAELTSKAGYTEVAVTVTDANGAYVHGLGKDAFSVTVDGSPRPIEFFQADSNPPASVGILVDTSGSMQAKIPQARIAISQFIRELDPRDDIFLVAFASKPFILQPFTTDHKQLVQQLVRLHAYGNTALFDAVVLGVQTVQQGCFQKKMLLVVTDGMNDSGSSTVEQVVLEAQHSDVLVYSIGIGDPNAIRWPSLAIGPFVTGGGDIERVDAETLTKLATETGGKTFIIRQVGDGDALRSACTSIADDLRAQYTLGLIAPASANGAPTGQLTVQLRDKPGLTVRTRESVRLPAASVSPAASPSTAVGR
jgi:Ca-activated chloride channel homolog